MGNTLASTTPGPDPLHAELNRAASMVSPSIVPDPLLDLRLTVCTSGPGSSSVTVPTNGSAVAIILRASWMPFITADGVAPEINLGHVAWAARRQAVRFEDEPRPVVRVEGCAVRPAWLASGDHHWDASQDEIDEGIIGDAAGCLGYRCRWRCESTGRSTRRRWS
jgi:hypothetical protein